MNFLFPKHMMIELVFAMKIYRKSIIHLVTPLGERNIMKIKQCEKNLSLDEANARQDDLQDNFFSVCFASRNYISPVFSNNNTKAIAAAGKVLRKHNKIMDIFC